jgi:hypothetical protein
MSVITLISGDLTGSLTGNTHSSVSHWNHQKTFQAKVVGTGAVTATAVIQCSNDALTWLDVGTITLSGTTSAADGFAHEAPWQYYRAKTTAVSGTSAAITVYMGK